MAKSILLTAMAGAMGWGIRGQYGHETGAMIAGVLVSLVLYSCTARTLPACRRLGPLRSAPSRWASGGR